MSATFSTEGLTVKQIATKRWKAANREYLNAWHREWLVQHGGSAQYRTKMLKERLATVEELKNAPCQDCGGTFPAVAMDFDHVRGEKVRSVSYLVRNSTWNAVLEEIAKCDLVCANCHRVRTQRRDESRNHAHRKGVI